ncbi:NupC/NupG family nucleoside CNT transporter [Candidatus Dependentiae bacterium]|nr:NupC/NupG family nucleoside CNT transporter [Candidatus Dependentiae bacterium]
MFSYLLEYNRYMNLIGIFVILGIAFLFSRNRRAINYKLVVNALILQFVIGMITLRTSIGHRIVQAVADVVTVVYKCADAGVSFVFGNLGDPSQAWGFIFAVKVLPIIIFFGALMAALFHWGIIQRVVWVIGHVVQPFLGTSGAETLCAVANSFLGQTEAPLLIRNYLPTMTKSEIMVVMISGMGTVSGAILAVFGQMGVPMVHLLTASVMAIPGSMLIAKILYPEEEKPKTLRGAEVSIKSTTGTIFDALSIGTTDGMYLALNVGAMLISFLSLIALVNVILGYGSQTFNYYLADLGIQIPALSLNYIFSYIFAPFGYLLGFTGTEAQQAGQLLGTKVTINELIAYSEMVKMGLSERVISIMTYALCGFSNFSCIGIQIGGIGALVPEKRAWLCELGLVAVLGGSLSNLLSALIAGLLL